MLVVNYEQYLHLSRNSPFLNTTKYTGCIIKQTVKRALGERDSQLEAKKLAAAKEMLHQHRIQALQCEQSEFFQQNCA